MKTTTINLWQYLELGGKLENVDLSKIRTTYYDQNRFEKIVSLDHTGENNDNNPLIYATFINGTVKRYAATWFDLDVEMVLNVQYTK